MALGDVKVRSNCKKDIVLLAAAVANNGAPALATDGIAMYEVDKLGQTSSIFKDGVNYPHQPVGKHRLCIKGTVDAGQTLVGTFTLWGYLESASAWFQVKVNGGSALAETGTDTIGYSEVFDLLSAFDRVYLQIASIGGTGASFDAWLVTCQEAF